MFVKSLTGLGKSLIILITSFTLVGCGTTAKNYNNSVSAYASVHDDYQNVNGSMVLVSNYIKWSSNRLDPYDQKQQEQAVFFALNNLQNGQETNWYNGNTGSRGRVRIIMTYPRDSGYCRVIQSQITYKGKSREFKEEACINAVENTWRFVR